MEVPPGLVVDADRERLEQVLVNLVENALRHGAPPVVVEGASVRDGARITVVDHGPGVPEDWADPSTAFRPGSASGSVGYGLRVADQLVAAHGGRLTCECRGGRARFSVVLPGAPSAQV